MSTTTVGEALVRIAGARSLKELGFACFEGVTKLTGSEAAGVYLLRDCKPKLLHAAQVPEGFLREYDADVCPTDRLLAYVCDAKRPSDGISLLGNESWRRSDLFDLLRRWDFEHCMAGPLSIDGEVMGIVYTSRRAPGGRYQEWSLTHMRLVCEAGSVALRTLLEGGGSVSRPSAARLPHDVPSKALPARAREVARLVCEGKTNKEIARVLGISPYTVKDHLSALCARFGAANRTDLAQRLVAASLQFH